MTERHDAVTGAMTGNDSNECNAKRLGKTRTR